MMAPPMPTSSQLGVTVWLTGLSGAGKTTLATGLASALRSRGRDVELLDGDQVRQSLSKGLGFTKEDRDTHIRRVAYVADMLTRHGVAVIVAAISPYQSVRDEARARIGAFLEVHVDCPLQVLVQRDVKGLYVKALQGEIPHFTGVSDPYEAPSHPDLHIDTSRLDAETAIARLLALLETRGYMNPTGAALPHGGRLEARMATPERIAGLAREAAGAPSLELDAWSLSDLELLAGGGLSPLRGFMSEDDVRSVAADMKLAAGQLFPLPVMLPVDMQRGRGLRAGSRVALTWKGSPLAMLTVDDVYEYDAAGVAEAVFGTADLQHPGVARFRAQPDTAAAGEVEVFALPEAPFGSYRLSPSETRAEFERRGWRSVVGFQTRNPVHRAHEYLQKVALEQVDGLLLHPLVEETKDGDVPAEVRMRCYEALVGSYYPADRVLLAVCPGSMRYAGPREAIFHAIVRQNYGCSHFMVGRDHAGVGSYYGSYDAQEIFDRLAPGDLDIRILKFENAFYCRACGGTATSKTCPHPADQRVEVSGTAARATLQAGGTLPAEFTRPEVAEVLRSAWTNVP
jgi:ATP sulfurylase/adenylyl-sulfate kinase